MAFLGRRTTISQTNLSLLKSAVYTRVLVLTYFKTIQVFSGLEELTDPPLKIAHVHI